MTLKTIYIARHGYRSNWLPPPHPAPPTGIDSDPALAPHGDDQAKELAEFFIQMPSNEQPQMIFTSPFYRCIQTLYPYAQRKNLKICLERGIGEWFKREREVHPIPGDYDLLSKFFDNLNSSYRSDQTIVPAAQGEDEEEIFKRCQIFWSKFIPLINEQYPEVENILLVSHAATKICLGLSLLGYQSARDDLKHPHVIDNEYKLRAGACSVDKFVLPEEGNPNDWSLSFNGRTDFLSAGEEMNWTFEYGFEAGSDEDIKRRQALALENSNAVKEEIEGGEEEEFEDVYVTLEIPAHQQTTTNLLMNDSISNSRKETADGPGASAGSGSGTGTGTGTGAASGAGNYYNDIRPNNNNTNTMQISGLETGSPLMLINQQLYQGQFHKLNGTELVLDDNADVVYKSRDRILLQKAELIPTDDTKTKETEEDEKLRKEIIANLPEHMAKSKNPNLMNKLMLAKKIEQEKKRDI